MKVGAHTQVLVVGGGVAGVIAAIAARRAGASVVLAEAHSYPGGMATQALVQPYQTFHSQRGQVIRGLPQKLVEKMIELGGSLGHKLDPLGFAATVTPMDDAITRLVMLDWLYEEGVDLLLNTAVIDLKVLGARIDSAKLATMNQSKLPPGVPFGHWQDGEPPVVNERWLDADVIIDATGCACMARRAGVTCELSYQRQPMSWLFAVGGVNEDGLRSYMRAHPDDFVLSSDARAFENGYIAVSGFFSLVQDAMKSGEWEIPRDRLLFFGTPTKGEVMVNTTRIPHDFGSDDKIRLEGLRQMSFLFDFLRDRVPGFTDSYITRKADRIGVRESYRAMGRYVLTRGDVVGGARFDDAIALGAFPIDIHSAKGSELVTESIGGRGYYDIPLRCLLTNEIENLVLAGRHISVTHEAFASTRVMPTSMAVGQAAGTAAAVIANRPELAELGGNAESPNAADEFDARYRELYARVRDLLLADGAVLTDEQVRWD